MLQADQLVDVVKVADQRIKITFKNGLVERWNIEPRRNFNIPEKPFLGNIVPIRNERQIGTNEDYYILKYKDYKLGSFYERQMSVHKFIDKFKITSFKYPDNDLLQDLVRVTELDLTKTYLVDGILTLHPSSRKLMPGWVLAGGLTDWPSTGKISVVQLLKYPQQIYSAIYRILKTKNDVSLSTLSNSLYRHWNHNNCFMAPGIYRAILNKFKITRMTVCDLYPDCGMKLVATALENCTYCTQDGNKLYKLAKFIGSEVDEDTKRCDLLLIDGSFSNKLDYSKFDMWRSMADVLIIYVPNDQVDRLPKPDEWLEVRHIRGTPSIGRVQYYI